MTVRIFCLLFLLGSLLTVATPAGAARCDTDVVPAATLLFPYFEVDLAAPNQQTTLLSVTNRDKEPVLARVTLWTDWAVPTLAFDLYLAGHDIQTLNLRDVLVQGLLPATGSAVSPHGRASGELVSFPGCNDTTEAGAAPVTRLRLSRRRPSPSSAPPTPGSARRRPACAPAPARRTVSPAAM